MPRQISTVDLLKASNEALRSGLHVCLPGKVESYDETTQTADVKPTIRNPITDPATGDPDSEEFPTIPNVMVIFPRGGGYHCSFPLSKGDHVVLVFSELATAQWRVTGEVAEAIDVRRQSLAYPFAIPGAFPDAALLADRTAYAGKMVIGKDGDPTGSIRLAAGSVECGGASPVPVALGAATKDALDALLSAVKDAFHAVGEGPVASGSAGALALEAVDAALTASFQALIATITKGQ